MLLATVLFIGCAFNDDEESFEDFQSFNIYRGDSIMQNLHNAASDTTYIPRQTNNRRDNNTPYECNLMANARLIIDGGNEKKNNPSLKVTVSKIVIQIYRDALQDESFTLSPEPSADIAEPTYQTDWHSAPTGITIEGKNLFGNPVSFIYNHYFDATMTVYYTLRVLDSHLADGCYTTHEWKTVKYSSNILHEKDITIDFPIELTSVNFDATVDNWNNR